MLKKRDIPWQSLLVNVFMGKKQQGAAQVFLNWFVFLINLDLLMALILTMKILSLKF